MRKFEKLIPPGAGTGEIKTFTILALTGAAILSLLLFVHELDLAVDLLYEDTYPPHTQFRPGAVMPGFWVVMGKKLLTFPICALCTLGFVIANYSYFFSESKSIYTMGRIPSRWELHIRCWALPVLSVVAILAAQWLLTLLCYIIYIRSVPEGVLL